MPPGNALTFHLPHCHLSDWNQGTKPRSVLAVANWQCSRSRNSFETSLVTFMHDTGLRFGCRAGRSAEQRRENGTVLRSGGGMNMPLWAVHLTRLQTGTHSGSGIPQRRLAHPGPQAKALMPSSTAQVQSIAQAMKADTQSAGQPGRWAFNGASGAFGVSVRWIICSA